MKNENLLKEKMDVILGIWERNRNDLRSQESHQSYSSFLHQKEEKNIQLSPAIADVEGPKNFICYWRKFVIANIGSKKK